MAKNILICDDAAFMRMMIKDILTKNGYVVAGEAENGLKAVEKYNNARNGWYPGIKEDQRERSRSNGHHVFRNGSAGDGYRIHPVRSKGLYR